LQKILNNLKMKNFKSIAVIILTSFLGFISCEKSELTQNEQNKSGITNPTSAKVIDAVHNGQNVKLLKIENNKYLLGGDIVLDRDDFSLPGEKLSARGNYAPQFLAWPNKTVYWKYSVYGVTASTKKAWLEAVAKWKTALPDFTFIQDDTKYKEVIIINNNSDNTASSSLGFKRGERRTISIDPNTRWGGGLRGALMHEIGHSLGLYHEHQRTNRDDAITILYDNIREDQQYAFFTETNGTPAGNFDFFSIMLYPSFTNQAIDFNKPVMVKKDGTTFIANTNSISRGDMGAIKKMYTVAQ
jgi:Astacin (Peptidase family M12A)